MWKISDADLMRKAVENIPSTTLTMDRATYDVWHIDGELTADEDTDDEDTSDEDTDDEDTDAETDPGNLPVEEETDNQQEELLDQEEQEEQEEHDQHEGALLPHMLRMALPDDPPSPHEYAPHD